MRNEPRFDGRRRLRRLVLAVACGWGCGGSGGEAESEGESESEGAAWAVIADGLDRVPRGVYGFGGDDVWVAGGWPDAGALALHFDGTTWEDLSPDSDATLWWVWGCAPDDVWLVGTAGAAFRWDGKAFTSYDSDTTGTLFGVWGPACDDVWSVGGTTMGGELDVMIRFDGTGWTREPTLTLCTNQDTGDPEPCGVPYFKVWGSAADDVFVVGPSGLVVRYDGDEWTRMASGTVATLFTVWGSGTDDVWAVGGQTGPATAIRWDGGIWSTVAGDWFDCGPVLQGVYVEPNRDAWISGLSGIKFRYEAATGEWQNDCAQDPLVDLHAVWGVGDGTAYTVGGNYFAETSDAPGDGVIAHFGVDHPPAVK